MATAAISGRSGSFYLTTGSTSAAQDEVAELRSFNLKVSRPNIEATNNDSSGWFEGIAGIGKWSGDIQFIHGSTVAGNVTVRTALLTPAQINCIFRPSTGTGSTYLWRGTAQITDWGITGETAGAFLMTASVEGVNGLTESTST